MGRGFSFTSSTPSFSVSTAKETLSNDPARNGSTPRQRIWFTSNCNLIKQLKCWSPIG